MVIPPATPPSAIASLMGDLNPDAFVNWKSLSPILQVYDLEIGALKGKQSLLTAIGLANLSAILVCVSLLVAHVLR